MHPGLPQGHGPLVALEALRAWQLSVCLSSSSSLEKEEDNEQLETETCKKEVAFFPSCSVVHLFSQGTDLGEPTQISVGEDNKRLGKDQE